MPDQTRETEAWNTISESFRAAHPHVDVAIETKPWAGRRETLLQAIAQGTGPHVFYINTDMIPVFAEQNAIVPITQYVTDEELRPLGPNLVVRHKGEIYAVPILQNPTIHVYNTDLVSKLGLDAAVLPSTISEFERWGEVAKKTEIYLSSLSGRAARAGLVTLVLQFGGRFYDEHGRVAVGEKETVAALQFLKQAYDRGWFPPLQTGDESETIFRDQKSLSLVVDANTFIEGGSTYGEAFRWAVGPTLGKTHRVPGGIVGSMAVSSNAPDRALAASWIAAVADPASLIALNKVVAYVPPLRSAAHGGEQLGAFLEVGAQIDPEMDLLQSWAAVQKIVGEQASAVVKGTKTPLEAVRAIQAGADSASSDRKN